MEQIVCSEDEQNSTQYNMQIFILDTSGAENTSHVFKILGDFQRKYTLYLKYCISVEAQ